MIRTVSPGVLGKLSHQGVTNGGAIWGMSVRTAGMAAPKKQERTKPCPAMVKAPPPKYKPVTHIIFDLDGTIIDSEDIIFCAMKRYLTKFKKKYDMDMHASVMGTRATDSAKFLVKQYKLPIGPDVFLHGIWQELMITLKESCEMPGVYPLVAHLNRCNVPICIATSSNEASFNLKVINIQRVINQFCCVVMGGSEKRIVRGKPHPDTFLFATTRFQDKPDSPDKVLVIEDSPSGVKAAKAAGMQVVMVPNKDLPEKYVKAAEPTILLNSLYDFNPKMFDLPGYPGK